MVNDAHGKGFDLRRDSERGFLVGGFVSARPRDGVVEVAYV